MNCPSCDSAQVLILESRVKANGDRRRRYKCNACLDRWTVFEVGVAPAKPQIRSYVPAPTRTLTDAEAASIMLSEESSAALAATFGITRQAIDAIRKGKTYTDVYTKLREEGQRLRSSGNPVCEGCIHWRGEQRCDFEFPDAGGDFATDCYLYRGL